MLETKKRAEAATAAINRTTKLTSGQLFRRDQICLTNPKILEEQLSYVAYKERQAKMAKTRRREERRRQLNRVREIRQKDEAKWSITDLRRMLTYKKRSGDTATTNIKDRDALIELWNKRKNRASPEVSDEEEDDVQQQQQQPQQPRESEERKLTVEEMADALGLDPDLPQPGAEQPHGFI